MTRGMKVFIIVSGVVVVLLAGFIPFRLTSDWYRRRCDLASIEEAKRLCVEADTAIAGHQYAKVEELLAGANLQLANVRDQAKAAVLAGMERCRAKAEVQKANDRREERSRQLGQATTQATAIVRAAGTPESKPSDGWTAWDRAAEADGIQVKITSATMGTVNVIDDGRERQSMYCLAIKVQIYNTTENRKFEYQTWASDIRGGFAPNAGLADEFGNVYRPINFGPGRTVVGRTAEQSLYPKGYIRDVLTFQHPIDAAKELFLVLPANNLGAKGEFRIRIPSSAFRTKSN